MRPADSALGIFRSPDHDLCVPGRRILRPREPCMCFMINRSICEDLMHDPDHRRLMCPSMRHYSCFFFRTMLVDLQIKAFKIADAPL